MESYHKRKKLLEEKDGKLITLKPFNDDIGKVNNTAVFRYKNPVTPG